MTSDNTETPSVKSRQELRASHSMLSSKSVAGSSLECQGVAVCPGVSYSTTRSWSHLPGFPAFVASSSGKTLSSGAPISLDYARLHCPNATTKPHAHSKSAAARRKFCSMN